MFIKRESGATFNRAQHLTDVKPNEKIVGYVQKDEDCKTPVPHHTGKGSMLTSNTAGSYKHQWARVFGSSVQ